MEGYRYTGPLFKKNNLRENLPLFRICTYICVKKENDMTQTLKQR